MLRVFRAVSVILLLVVVIVSLAIVRLAAVALELTGVPWDRAKFHALSAFTNTGFPTREAEEVVRHPFRRKIVGYLIVLGNAGLITTIATFASSLVETNAALALRNLAIVVSGVILIVWVARKPALAVPLKAASERWLSRRYALHASPPSELMHLHEGYALERRTVDAGSPAAGMTLDKLRHARSPVQVLVIERGTESYPLPDADMMLHPGDRIVVYAAEADLPRAFGPGP